MPRARNNTPAECVLEVVTPRTNAALITAAEHLFAALTLDTGANAGGAVAAEIVADAERCRFFVRTGTSAQQRRVAAQLAAAYPQAGLHCLDSSRFPTGDPAVRGPDEQVRVCTLRLRASPC